MPNANNHQEHASSVPQSTELNSTVSAAPRHEQTTVSSYPVLPGRDQQPTYPSVAYVPTVVGQPQPGICCVFFFFFFQFHFLFWFFLFNTVVVQLVPQSPPVGPASTSLTCPSCKALISTKVNYAPSVKTHVIALILCLVGYV